MNRALYTMLASLAIIAGGCAERADAQASTMHVWQRAHHVMRDTGAKARFWDGAYLQKSHHGFCVELFNPTDHDVKPFANHKGKMPPGFFIKVCADGNYYVNDGQPFEGMAKY